MQTPINPPALPGSPSRPADPSPHRHSPAKWTATTFIGVTRHCQMLMAPAEKESYPCIYQVILTFFNMLLPHNPRGKCDNWCYLHRVFLLQMPSGGVFNNGSPSLSFLTLQTEMKPVTGRLAETSNSNLVVTPPRYHRTDSNRGRLRNVMPKMSYVVHWWAIDEKSKSSCLQCCYNQHWYVISNANKAWMNQNTRPHLIWDVAVWILE